jgi:hypothetical protein
MTRRESLRRSVGDMNTGQLASAPCDRYEHRDRRYDSFLVRVWATDAGRRVEVEHVQSCKRIQFDSLPAAFRWIAERSAHRQAGAPVAR